MIQCLVLLDLRENILKMAVMLEDGNGDGVVNFVNDKLADSRHGNVTTCVIITEGLYIQHKWSA